MRQDTLSTKLIIGVILVAMLTYLIASGIKTVTNPYQFVGVYTDLIEKTVSLNTWAFRSEQPLDPAKGLLSYRLDEGEKARAGQLAVISYTDQQALLQQQQTRLLREQVAQLAYAITDEAPGVTNLENEVVKAHATLQSAAATGSFTHLVDEADSYKKLVLRREYLQTETAASEMGLASLSLNDQLTAMESTAATNAQGLYTPASGLFSTYVDGYEQIFRPELLTEEFSPTQLRALIATPPQANVDAVAKVVSGNTWRLVMLVPEAGLDAFRRQSDVSVRISSLAEPIPMTVERVGFVENGEGVVVLSSRQNADKALSLREQTASIVFQSEEGIRVPKQALRTTENGAPGVYAVTGYRAEFKPVTVVEADQNDYIVRANPEKSTDRNILRSGDLVIVSSAELYEGKVVR